MANIDTQVVKTDELRITKLRTYLFSIIDTLLTDNKYQINANMLSNEPNNYSLDKIPTSSTVEEWITVSRICRDVYSFRSRVGYSQDTINNLKDDIRTGKLYNKEREAKMHRRKIQTNFNENINTLHTREAFN